LQGHAGKTEYFKWPGNIQDLSAWKYHDANISGLELKTLGFGKTESHHADTPVAD
jgi:hypothetical protein